MRPVTRRANHAYPRNRGWLARCLAALLVVLASTAYVTRDLTMAAPGEHRALHRPGMGAMGHGTASPGKPGAGHDHSGHCPFCFAPAFGLEADPGLTLVSPAPALAAATPDLALPLARPAENPAALPRAPPVSRLT